MSKLLILIKCCLQQLLANSYMMFCTCRTFLNHDVREYSVIDSCKLFTIFKVKLKLKIAQLKKLASQSIFSDTLVMEMINSYFSSKKYLRTTRLNLVKKIKTK